MLHQNIDTLQNDVDCLFNERSQLKQQYFSQYFIHANSLVPGNKSLITASSDTIRERTGVLYDTDNVIDAELQFFSNYIEQR
jgi:hypothetical protein